MARDTLSDLLRSVRLRGAVFYYVSVKGRWAVESTAAREIAAAVMPGSEHVMEYHMLTKGSGWAAVRGEQPVRLAAHDVVIFPQGDCHVLSSAPDVTPDRRAPEWVFSRRDEKRPMPFAYRDGVGTEKSKIPADQADAIVMCGFLGCDLRPFNPLVAALPRLMHLPAAGVGGWIAQAIEQAVDESSEPRPGSDAVLERLSEMMFVDAARRYLETLPEDAVGWLAALRDRFVGRALAILHDRPAEPWTIELLAGEVGLSRSALHERFVRFVGQPPMQYLANWRIQVGARLLRETSRTVASIALEAGYESEAAFCRAFKRLVGQPPATWRRGQEPG